jgi:hypothetical protein
MKDFSKRINAGWNFAPEFFFHKLYSVSGNQRYHVSVNDKEGGSFFFNMDLKKNGSWKIIDAPKVPDWIMVLESQLQDAIMESLVA